MSLRVSLKNCEVEKLRELLSVESDPDLCNVGEKLSRDRRVEQCAGQLALEDYPEVFENAA